MSKISDYIIGIAEEESSTNDTHEYFDTPDCYEEWANLDSGFIQSDEGALY